MKREGIFFCLVGPAGGGKTTMATRLLTEDRSSASSVSVTSRPPRSDEQEGVHYHFVSREEFLARIQSGDFFEWEETHGNLYGTLKSSLEKAKNEGIDLILDIDIRGAITFQKCFPNNTVAVFLVPPSGEVLKERLAGRGSTKEDIEVRISSTLREYESFFLEKDRIGYFIVNNDRDETYRTVCSILEAERASVRRIPESELKQICQIR